MNKYEYRGLVASMVGAYDLGKSGIEICAANLRSVGIPRNIFMRFSLNNELINTSSKIQLLQVLNSAGHKGQEVDFEELESKANKIGRFAANTGVISFSGKPFGETVEETVEELKYDPEYVKSITPENNSDADAKALLIDYAESFGVTLDKRTGFAKSAAKLAKEVQN